MQGMNRKGAGGAGAMKGQSGGKCRQAGEAGASGQRMGQSGGWAQGSCRRQQSSGRGQGSGRGGACRGKSSDNGTQSSLSSAAQKPGIVREAARKADLNQQTLDEIMDAVRQMGINPRGEK